MFYQALSDHYCQSTWWLACTIVSRLTLLIFRRCGLAYFTLHAAKQGWQLLTS